MIPIVYFLDFKKRDFHMIILGSEMISKEAST